MCVGPCLQRARCAEGYVSGRLCERRAMCAEGCVFAGLGSHLVSRAVAFLWFLV